MPRSDTISAAEYRALVSDQPKKQVRKPESGGGLSRSTDAARLKEKPRIKQLQVWIKFEGGYQEDTITRQVTTEEEAHAFITNLFNPTR